MELGYIRPRRKLDTHFWSLRNLLIILRKSFANFRCSHADDGVVRGVIIDGPPKHFCADHAPTQAVHFPRQSMPHDELEEVLAALASTERITGNHRFERPANHTYLFSAELVRFVELGVCQHLALNLP